MEVEGSKKPSVFNMGDLLGSLPKTPKKQGFLAPREPSKRPTKGQRSVLFENTEHSVWKTSLKKRPSTKRPIKPTELEKMKEEVEKAVKGKSPEESKKILDMAGEIVEEEEDPLTKLLGALKLGGRTRRRKNKRNHKSKRKTKRSSY